MCVHVCVCVCIGGTSLRGSLRTVRTAVIPDARSVRAGNIPSTYLTTCIPLRYRLPVSLWAETPFALISTAGSLTAGPCWERSGPHPGPVRRFIVGKSGTNITAIKARRDETKEREKTNVESLSHWYSDSNSRLFNCFVVKGVCKGK